MSSARRGGKARKGRRPVPRSRELTYTAPRGFTPDPPPERPPGTDVLWDYTLAEMDRMASSVVANNRHWWPAGDRSDQHDAAWHGIAECLCTAAARPSRIELLEAGRRALAADVRDQMRHHGARNDGTNNGSNYTRYWAWHSVPSQSPERSVVDRIAVQQILSSLTHRQFAAVRALAAQGDYVEAARVLGVRPQTFRSLLGRARQSFLALWHEGETPSRLWGCDRRVLRRDTSDPAELDRRARYAAKKRRGRAA